MQHDGWLNGAVEETLGPGSAWELLEAELLGMLSKKLVEKHPLAAGYQQSGPSDADLQLAEAAAAALLLQQQAVAETQRDSVVRAAWAAVSVRRAVRRFKMCGKRNVAAQLEQAV